MQEELYKIASLPIEVRVDDLISRMTLDEKLAQLGCVWITDIMDQDGFSCDIAKSICPHGVGEITRISGSTALLPRESARIMNHVQKYMVEDTRLGIPVLVHEEGTGGFLARGATIFPQALALAATFDTTLVEEVAGVVRDQMISVGARHALAPVLDIARDPRWGRVEETFGEDPYLVGTMGTAYVRGLQTGDLTKGVLATGKHFIAHGLSEGGRNHAPVHVGLRELYDVYAEPFGMAISQAGLAAVMNSYSSVDGLPCAASPSILQNLLRDMLGFDGIVVADYFSISLLMDYHHVAADKEEAAIRAINAGMDMELPATDCFGDPLKIAIQEGKVKEETIELAVRRILSLKIRLGLFESPYVNEDTVNINFETDVQRSLAHRSAAASVVLLKNNGILPIRTTIKKIAVVGPAADDERLLQGDYHYPAHQQIVYDNLSESVMSDSWNGGANLSMLPRSYGEWQPGPYFTRHITPLEGIKSFLEGGVEVSYAKGCDITGEYEDINTAVAAVKAADIAVVVVGGRSGLALGCTVGEARDATDLSLTGYQEQLVKEVCQTGVPTIVIVMSGRVHTLTQIAESAAALLQAWPLGEEGGRALADVLFGRLNPSGRLPVSFPRSVGQVPVYLGHLSGGSTSMFYGSYTDNQTTPLFPFGHGLSYTTFSYGDFFVSATDTTSPVYIHLSVSNTGDIFGEEVVQCYMRDVAASVARPEKQLVAYAKVGIEPGEACSIDFEIPVSELAFTDEFLSRVVEPGLVKFFIGKSSEDIILSGEVMLKGEPFHCNNNLHEITRVSVVRK
jgi:beta-glucosidase